MSETDINLTPRETQIMTAAFLSMKTWPEIDYHKLAEKLGMTNDRSASNAMASLRKKIGAHENMVLTPPKPGRKSKAGDGSNDTASKDTPANSKKAGRNTTKKSNEASGIASSSNKRKADFVEALEGDEVIDTPTKKVKNSEAGDEITWL